MTPEQAVAIVVAVAGLLGAFALVLQRLAELRKALDGAMTEIRAQAYLSGTRQGELTGRDFRPAPGAAAEPARSSPFGAQTGGGGTIPPPPGLGHR